MADNDNVQFRMIPGGGDMIDALEDALERVRSGELEGIVICEITSNQMCGWMWAHKDDIAAPWPRLLAIVSTAQQELARDGLKVND